MVGGRRPGEPVNLFCLTSVRPSWGTLTSLARFWGTACVLWVTLCVPISMLVQAAGEPGFPGHSCAVLASVPGVKRLPKTEEEATWLSKVGFYGEWGSLILTG